MKKRIFSVLLAFAMALTAVLCGCGDKSASVNKGGIPTASPPAQTEQAPQETAPVSTPEETSQETEPVSTPEETSQEAEPVSTPEETSQDTLAGVETVPAIEPVEMRVVSSEDGETVTVTFSALPTTLEQITSADGALLDSPFKTAALTVCALCVFSQSEEDGIKMLNALQGPEPLSDYGIKFLRERFHDIGGYVPFSYFDGAAPDNDYTPDQPLTVTVFTNPYSYDADGYASLYINSGGADSARSVSLRNKPSTGEWFLQEQFLMVQIRTPTSQDPWA